MLPRLSFIILFIFIFTFQSNLFGQRIKGALIAGMNVSQVDGDEIYGFKKVGLNAGASATLPIGKWFTFTIETLYSQKGSNQQAWYYDSVELQPDSTVVWTGAYKLKTDYLEVPILFHFDDGRFISVGLGFSYGRIVNVKEWEHGNLVETTSLNTGPYDKNDYSILGDLQFRVHRKVPMLKFNIRYAYSLSKIRTRDFYNSKGEYTGTRDQYHNLFSLRVIYVFNEKSKRLADPN